LDTNKHSNRVEHINWVLSELSAGVNKMLNHTGRTIRNHTGHTTVA